MLTSNAGPESAIDLGSRDNDEIDPAWAWAPYEPDEDHPWDLARAAHLYRRAAFGANWRQLRQALEEGPRRTVDRILKPAADVAAFNGLHDEYAQAATDSSATNQLRAWWLRRMIETPHPLLEKLTLFWHDHFATSNVGVKSALLMHRHAQILRRHALGSFRSLLQDVALDPAFLLGLDAQVNRRRSPCEHYARSLIEVFTLGPGIASERDIREVARAFTGWVVRRKESRFIPREHDPGVKRIFGRAGPFGSQEVIGILLSNPALARRLVTKLYRWLISEVEVPGDALVAPLADSFRRDYDVADLVRTMLCSNLFFSPHAYRRRIKNPVEFALGIVIGLEGMVGTVKLGSDLAALGQDLYQPPTANGWAGGRDWINQSTLLGRANLARALLAPVEPYGDRLDPLATVRQHGQPQAGAAGEFMMDLMLQSDLSDEVQKSVLKEFESRGDSPSERLRRLVYRIVTLPEFQLS